MAINPASLAASIQAQARNEINNVAILYIQNMVVNAIREAGSEAAHELALYMQQAESEWSDVRKGLIADARKVGEIVQTEAWSIVEDTRVRDPVDPRVNSRLHGTLHAAIEKMVEPTAQGAMIRVDILDDTARHWRRLNYGAGAAGGGNPPIDLGIQSGPSPAFSMPPGFWVNSEGRPVPWGEVRGDFFLPMRRNLMTGSNPVFRSVRTETKGIAAKFFLEKAVQRAGKEFPVIVRERIAAWASRVVGQNRSGRVIATARP